MYTTDAVSVVLRNGNKDSKCYGDVYISVNGSPSPVCGSHWTKEEAEVVCRQLNCGKVLFFIVIVKPLIYVCLQSFYLQYLSNLTHPSILGGESHS